MRREHDIAVVRDSEGAAALGTGGRQARSPAPGLVQVENEVGEDGEGDAGGEMSISG